jgi:hypothetical protein
MQLNVAIVKALFQHFEKYCCLNSRHLCYYSISFSKDIESADSFIDFLVSEKRQEDLSQFLVLRKSYSRTEGDYTDWNHSIMESDAIMEKLALKIRLAVLWLFVAVAMSANTILYFVVPGVIDEIRTGKVVGMQATPELLLVMAITYFWVPLVMAVLSLSLRDRGNRLANIVSGIFYSVFILFELVMNITTVAYPYLILMDISVIVVSALIAWYAWKWT